MTSSKINLHSALLALDSWCSWRGADNKAAAAAAAKKKSYSKPISAPVNTEKDEHSYELQSKAVIALNYSWNLLHHNQLQQSLTEWFKREKMNNKALGIIWEDDLWSRLGLITAGELSSSLCLLFKYNREEKCLSVIWKKKKGWQRIQVWKILLQGGGDEMWSHTGISKWTVQHLANSFSAKEPQDCVVVGGGHQIQNLQKRTGKGREGVLIFYTGGMFAIHWRETERTW